MELYASASSIPLPQILQQLVYPDILQIPDITFGFTSRAVSSVSTYTITLYKIHKIIITITGLLLYVHYEHCTKLFSIDIVHSIPFSFDLHSFYIYNVI